MTVVFETKPPKPRKSESPGGYSVEFRSSSGYWLGLGTHSFKWVAVLHAAAGHLATGSPYRVVRLSVDARPES